jgi:hypothetical protein
VRLDIHIQSAFETLDTPEVTDEAFLNELRGRGLSAEDSELALEKALLEGLLERLPNGLLRQRSGSVAEEMRDAGADENSARVNSDPEALP